MRCLLNKELENILICPITKSNLIWLTEDDLRQLNERIKQGEITDSTSAVHTIAIAGGLKVSDHDLFYPIVQDIVYVLPTLALAGRFKFPIQVDVANKTKNEVKRFYDDWGWQENEGVFKDAQDSEDLRRVSQKYILNCHLRLNQHLPNQGKYLLDIASGPIQYDAYLSYSQHYEYRICADISLRALTAAKQKLGSKGIYLLCDVTQLPLKSNSIDAIVSLHTLYHVPQQQQLQGFAELYRALKPAGVSVIVYSWGHHSLLMNLLLWPLKIYFWLKRRLKSSTSEQDLYFYAHNYQWFCDEIKVKYQTQLFSWRSVNVPFLKLFIHRFLGGKQILSFIYFLENRFPKAMGKWGAYPLFVSKKSNVL